MVQTNPRNEGGLEMEMADLRPMKKLVRRDFPEDSPYRKLVLAQPDKMPRDEFIIKAMDWVLLLPERRRG
jgi:hypothetical protein